MQGANPCPIYFIKAEFNQQKTLMKKWWNREIPQPWLTICWLIALTILMLYGYALSLAL